jgi:hypothetical protein
MHGVKLDYQEIYQKEEQITVVLLLMISKKIYNSIFIIYYSLYIHGGRDIKEGSMNNMWRLSISGIKDLIEDPEYTVSWEMVKQTG